MTSVDHSGCKLGRTPSRPEDIARVPRVSAFLGPALPTPPPLIDYLSGMSSLPMLGNDKYGDCFYAAAAHLIQAQTAAMGSERIFTEAETLAMYSRDTGFNPDDPDTDQGANMFDGLTSIVSKGFCEVQFDGFALIDTTNALACHQALDLFGGVLWGVDLPLAAQHQNRWRLEMGLGDAQNTPGGWGGHAVSQARSVIQADGLPEEDVITWGGAKPVDQTFRDNGCVSEVYVLVPKDWRNPRYPNFDHAGLLAAMKELRL